MLHSEKEHDFSAPDEGITLNHPMERASAKSGSSSELLQKITECDE